MSYFESRLPIDIYNLTEVQKKLKLCEELGIKNVIIEPKKIKTEIILENKKAIERETNLNIFYRVNLKLDNLNAYKSRIKHFNNFSDILSIESLNKEVQIHAARDSRVDIISFSDPEIMKTLTPGVISLTRQNNSFLEFSMAPIMVRNKIYQSKNFRNLYRTIQLALKLKANCIISGNFDDIYDFRHPRALISICNSLLGIPLGKAKNIFTINPNLLIGRSKKRVDNKFEPEVRILSNGDIP
ncbi:MAG: RNase P subunit p30 family protein [Candidatus Thorarchaeota archaeon]